MGNSIRLLVVDEAVAPGGVERLWLRLLPEIATFCEKVVWMLPMHRLTQFRDTLPSGVPIEFEPLHGQGWKQGNRLNALMSRVARLLPKAASQTLQRHIANRYLRATAQRHRVTHLLYPALFNQPFPEIALPVAAAVMDVNYHPHWRDECLRNLAVWIRRASQLISISEFTRTEIIHLHPHAVAKVKAIAITSDGPSSNACPQNYEASRGKEGGPILYYPASFNPHKGHATLLRALRLLHEEGLPFRLILTGSGTDKIASQVINPIPELEDARHAFTEASDSFRQKVEIHGMTSAEMVENYYRFADFVVLPSLYEGFGLPLAEAVARGKHVLCSDIPAFREQIAIYDFHTAVSLVREFNPSAWSEAIRGLMEAPTLTTHTVEEIRSFFAHRTWTMVAKDYVRTLSVA